MAKLVTNGRRKKGPKYHSLILLHSAVDGKWPNLLTISTLLDIILLHIEEMVEFVNIVNTITLLQRE